MFLKIFLWFWLAIAAVVGALTLVSWSLQNNDPLQSRWRVAVGNSLRVYAGTAKQIYDNEGERGLQEFMRRLESAREDQNFCLASRAAANQCFPDADARAAQELIDRAFESDALEIGVPTSENNYFAQKFTTATGAQFVLTLKTQRARPVTDSRTQLLRILAVILAAGAVCYALAWYLTSPLRKLRAATQEFASGDFPQNLSVRVYPKIGKRLDEISALARDFDEMAVRIENLIAAQKNLTTDISHELRSPLARLGVALELARGKAAPEAKPALDRIERESARLNEMIGQMLLLSKLESGAANIEKAQIDLAQILRETVADADFEANNQNKAVRIIHNEPCVVRGEANLLRSAVENVVRNAVRYTPEQTNVEVSLRRENGTAEIRVRDYGAGVPAEDLPKLFRPFYRVGYARERNAGGIGLGLAITERAARAHGGTVTAENAADGGLVVTLRLES